MNLSLLYVIVIIAWVWLRLYNCENWSSQDSSSLSSKSQSKAVANTPVKVDLQQITVNIFYFSFRTPFGTQEYEVSCHTYLDSHRAEQDVNHFMIMMGVPGDDVYPVAN